MPKSTELATNKPGKTAMYELAVTALLERLVPNDNSHGAEALRREIRLNAESLAGPSPTMAEVVLGETAALALYALRLEEFRLAHFDREGGTIKQANYHLGRIEHAQRRLQSALKTLATVRRLALPAVQVNLAQNQVVSMSASSG